MNKTRAVALGTGILCVGIVGVAGVYLPFYSSAAQGGMEARRELHKLPSVIAAKQASDGSDGDSTDATDTSGAVDAGTSAAAGVSGGGSMWTNMKSNINKTR